MLSKCGRLLAALPICSLLVTGMAPGRASWALLVDAATSTASLTTDALNPPTGLAATGGAAGNLSWTPTVDSYASGYGVLRSAVGGSGYVQVGTATPQNASSYIDTPPQDGTYYYVVQSYMSNWTSVNTPEVSAVVKMGVTGFRSCGSQLLDTGGDNNGYEGSPTNGCSDDGIVATDTNSGSSTSTSCTASSKDRHRFWTFGLGVPAAVGSINGISVRIREGVDLVSGTVRVCAQLSWDAGVSWTATQQVDLTRTALTTYTLGGATFLWGRTWAVGDLSDLNFRVRLIDVGSSTSRDFTLDSVQVQVNYTP